MRFCRELVAIVRHASRLATALMLVLVVASSTTACSRAPTCTGNLHEYQGKCLTNTAIVYMECTSGRGFDSSSEIGGSLGGTFKVVADASLQLAYKTAKTENKDVSLQIVHDCLQIAGQAAESSAEKADSQNLANQADAYLAAWRESQVKQTPHITVSSSSAPVGASVTVSGMNFFEKETVQIRVHVTVVEQIEADSKGAFTTTIRIPANAPPPGFPTSITATGVTSAKSAESPFEVGG